MHTAPFWLLMLIEYYTWGLSVEGNINRRLIIKFFNLKTIENRCWDFIIRAKDYIMGDIGDNLFRSWPRPACNNMYG